MSFRLLLSPRARRDLAKLDRSTFLRLDKAILDLAKEPFPPVARPLRDKRLADFRIRVGDYRILYDVYREDKAVYILRVGHRKDIYK